jgi:hypothetical protein
MSKSNYIEKEKIYMSNPLRLNNYTPLDVKNITLVPQTILTADETTLANLTLDIDSNGNKVYFAADVAFIFVNFPPDAIPADFLTFRVYRDTTLIFEKIIYCSNYVILSSGTTRPSLTYVYEPTEANFFCIDTPPLTFCDCDKKVTYTLTVQSTMIDTYTISPDNSTSTFITVELNTKG